MCELWKTAEKRSEEGTGEHAAERAKEISEDTMDVDWWDCDSVSGDLCAQHRSYFCKKRGTENRPSAYQSNLFKIFVHKK